MGVRLRFGDPGRWVADSAPHLTGGVKARPHTARTTLNCYIRHKTIQDNQTSIRCNHAYNYTKTIHT